MAQHLDFTATQRKRLKDIGVIPEQVERLRAVLVVAHSVLERAPAQNDVKAALEEVSKHAHSLMAILRPMVSRNDAVRAEAIERIDDAFLDYRRDTGQTMRFSEGEAAMRSLIPQLQHLRTAARSAIEKVGLHPNPTRSRTALWMPVGAIDGALRDGWEQARPQQLPAKDPVEQVPEQFQPTARQGSTFREVVGICYEAAGAGVDADPLRAIRAYMSIRGGSAAKHGKNKTYSKT